MKKLPVNEDGIKVFSELIESLYKAMGEPLPHGEAMRGGVDNYTNAEGVTDFSKMMRNSVASQRLFSLKDKIADLIFTHQCISGDIKFGTENIGKPFIDEYMSRNLTFLTMQAVGAVCNYTAYYFDLDTKDASLEFMALRNFLFIHDPEVCLSIESYLLKADSVQTIESLFAATKNDYLGLSTTTYSPEKNMTTTAITGYPVEEIIENSKDILNRIYNYLIFFEAHIKDKYKNLGFDSPNDFAVSVNPEGGFYQRAEQAGIDAAKRKIPVKIFNLTTDTPTHISTDSFDLYKTRTFDDLKDLFYRSGTRTHTTFKFGKEGTSEVKRTSLPPQEGALYWTHTYIPKNDAKQESRFLFDAEYIEDVCLLLTWLGGRGVYTQQSSLRYSHKAKSSVQVHSIEMASALNQALSSYSELGDDKVVGIGLALTKYRESLQPMSANIELVRQWEIIDMLADLFCENPMKNIPKEYKDRRDDLLNDVIERLKIAEEGTPFDFTGDEKLTPVMLDKSIGQKLNELIEKLGIAAYLEVDPQKLNSRIKQSYSFRSKFTHSSKAISGNKKKDLEFIGYYFFSAQLLFVILLKIFSVNAPETILGFKRDFAGFLENKNYFDEKSRAISAKTEKMEEALKYSTGEKEIPDGKEIKITI